MVYQRRTDFCDQTCKRWACSSAGEHYVDIVGVTGSIPVTPTIFFLTQIMIFALHFATRFVLLSQLLVE